jgi:ATP-dependent Clp protease adaptor protein ClpS
MSAGESLFRSGRECAIIDASSGGAPSPMSDDNQRRGSSGTGGPASGVATKTRPKTKRPSLYKVLLLNDDYTPMEFVVHILERFFNKAREEAVQIMLHVHRHGVGICGVFTYEVAETKVAQVIEFSRRHQHPLQCTMEKE